MDALNNPVDFPEPETAANKITVAIRVRPLIQREIQANDPIHWQIGASDLKQWDPETRRPVPHTAVYPYDHVFGQEKETRQVYDRVVAPIVNKAFEGFNGTVLCYGQTSSGKTHTLYGSADSPNDKGIISLFAEHVFKYFQANGFSRTYIMKVGLIEIYNEKVYDLLNSENEIDIGDKGGQFFPKDLEELTVYNESQLNDLVKRLQRLRKIGETRMNKESSRSHTILRVTIESFDSPSLATENDKYIPNDQPQTSTSVTSAVLHFVDLAGSEKQSQTGAEGERLKEAISINQSLSKLSLVIKQLSEKSATSAPQTQDITESIPPWCTTNGKPGPKPRIISTGTFINYRDSKLTKLLKSTLSGEAFMTMICNVTIASLDETRGTLNFAKMAKKVAIQPKQNVCSDKSDVERKVHELTTLLENKDKEMQAMSAQLQNYKLACRMSNATQLPPLPEGTTRRLSFCPSTLNRHSDFDYNCRKSKQFPVLNGEMFKTAEDSLREFRKSTILAEICEETQVEKGVQTDPFIYKTPKKNDEPSERRANNDTPIQTLRLTNTLLRDTNELDKSEWKDQKYFLELELKEAKEVAAEMKQINEKLTLEKQELENDVIRQMSSSQNLVKRQTAELELRIENLECELKQAKSETPELKEIYEKLTLEKQELENDVLRQISSSESLKRQTAELELRIETQQLDLKEARDVAAELKEINDKLTLQKQELERDVQQQISSSEDLKRQTAELDLRIENLECELKQAKSETPELKEINEKLTLEKQQLENDVQRQISSSEDLIRQTEELRLGIETLEFELKQAKNETPELKEIIQKLTLEKQELENDVQRQISSSEDLKRHTADLELRIESLECELKQAESETPELKEIIQKLTLEKQELEQDVQRQISSSEDLIGQTAELRLGIESLGFELKQAKSETPELKEIIQKLSLEKQELENDVQRQISSSESLKRQTAELELRIESLEFDLKQAKRETPELKEINDKLTLEKQELENHFQRQVSSSEDLKRLNAELELRLESLESELKQAESETPELKEIIQKLTLEKQELENDVQRHISSSESLKRQTEELELRIESLEFDLKQTKSETPELKEIIQKLTLEKQELENDVQRHISSSESLKRQTAELDLRIESLECELKQAKSEIPELKEIIQNLTLEKQELENDVQRQISSSEDLKRHTADLELRIESLECELKQAETETPELKQINETLTLEKHELEKEVQRHISSLHDMKRETAELQLRIGGLECELKQAKSETPEFKEIIQKLTLQKQELEIDVQRQISSSENLKRQTAELELRIESLECELKQAKCETPELEKINHKLTLEKQELEKVVQRQISSSEDLKRQTAELELRIENLECELKQAKSETPELEKINLKLTLEKQELEDVIQRHISSSENLKRQTAELELRIESLECDLKQAETETPELKEIIQKLTLEKQELANDVQRQISSSESLKRQTADLELRIESLEFDLKQAKRETPELKEINQKLTLEKQELENDVQRQISSSEDLKRQTAELELRIENFECALKQAESETSELKEINQKLTLEKQELENVVQRQISSSEDLKRQRAELELRIGTLEAEHKTVVSDLQHKLKESEELSMSIEGMKNLINDLEQQVRVLTAGRPLKVSRGAQCEPFGDCDIKRYKDAALHYRQKCRVVEADLQKLKSNLDTQLKSKDVKIIQLESQVQQKLEEIHILTERNVKIKSDEQNDFGIQCTLLEEQIKSKGRGDAQLPAFIPDTTKLSQELSLYKSRYTSLQIRVNKCKCNPSVTQLKTFGNKQETSSSETATPDKLENNAQKFRYNKPPTITPGKRLGSLEQPHSLTKLLKSSASDNGGNSNSFSNSRKISDTVSKYVKLYEPEKSKAEVFNSPAVAPLPSASVRNKENIPEKSEEEKMYEWMDSLQALNKPANVVDAVPTSTPGLESHAPPHSGQTQETPLEEEEDMETWVMRLCGKL